MNKRFIRVSAFLLILMLLITSSSICLAGKYNDVASGKWYASYIDNAARLGLFHGEDGAFYPERSISRAEVVTVLGNIVAADTASYKNNSTAFQDVKKSSWYAGAVKWAAANGVVSGVSKTAFAPDKFITRAEMCTMIYRFAAKFGFALPAGGTTAFADQPSIAVWARDAIAACKRAGIVSGKPGNLFDPNGNTTRAESAKMLGEMVRIKVLPNCALKIHTIDVGQGDSIFAELPGGKCMLIDAGLAQYGKTVVDYITGLGYHTVDYVVATHPHADHIGGMATVLGTFTVGTIYMPNVSHTTPTYENLLQTIADKGMTVTTAKAGVLVSEQGGCKVEFIAPTATTDSDINSYSAVVKITYGQKKFLLMGDATKESEAGITADVAVDWIKVGHHGSLTSSSAAFVQNVGARYAIISVGLNNSYGLPKSEIVTRWRQAGATVFRTDFSGTIVTYCNGKVLLVNADAAEEPSGSGSGSKEQNYSGAWVLNTDKSTVHLTDCPFVGRIDEKYRSETNETLEYLLDEKGCHLCYYCELRLAAAEDQNSGITWILNTNSLAVHLPDCFYVARMSEKYRSETNETLEYLLEEKGCHLCSYCEKRLAA